VWLRLLQLAGPIACWAYATLGIAKAALGNALAYLLSQLLLAYQLQLSGPLRLPATVRIVPLIERQQLLLIGEHPDSAEHCVLRELCQQSFQGMQIAHAPGFDAVCAVLASVLGGSEGGQYFAASDTVGIARPTA